MLQEDWENQQTSGPERRGATNYQMNDTYILDQIEKFVQTL